MTDERRFSEEEVREIITRATEEMPGAPPATRSASEGLTLRELKDIGSEVGISPERIEQAATGLVAVSRTAPPAKFLGLPEAVSHVVEIPRPLSEPEWARVVADARETFDALGEMQGSGHTHAWRNGNLQVVMEPSPDGEYRVRMQTKKGDARAGPAMGVFSLAFAVLFVVLMAVRGDVEAVPIVISSLLGLMGVGAWAATAYQLPRWAAERQAQMEGIGERVKLLVAETDG